MVDFSSENLVVLCPKCEAPYSYSQVSFRGGSNDYGYWRASCAGCGEAFLIEVNNPAESSAQFKIDGRFDRGDEIPELPLATEKVTHNVPKTDYAPSFDYSGAMLYRCQNTGLNLEHMARQALLENFEGVTKAYQVAENYLCSRTAFKGENAVVHVNVPCSCISSHIATFYTGFPIDFITRPIEAYLLADVSCTDVADRLEGLFSKSEIMSFLSKLLIRWHLTCDQIIVASPFIGHKFDKQEQSLDRWSWLLSQLNPKRATLITRPATFSVFRNLSDKDVTYTQLKRYGLENKIISANAKKHDFHAKFFIGLATESCEVLSGSANLVHGPSIENVTFRSISAERCKERYLDVINVNLPAKKSRSAQYVHIRQSPDGNWRSSEAVGWPLVVT